MIKYLAAYVGTGLAFGAIDAVWLTTMNERLYKPVIGSIMKTPDFTAIIAFYLIYILGVVVLAILPALREGGLGRAAMMGAALGFVAYATYDLTNQATLAAWSWKLTFADIAWGTILTGSAASAGYLAARFAETRWG